MNIRPRRAPVSATDHRIRRGWAARGRINHPPTLFRISTAAKLRLSRIGLIGSQAMGLYDLMLLFAVFVNEWRPLLVEMDDD